MTTELLDSEGRPDAPIASATLTESTRRRRRPAGLAGLAVVLLAGTACGGGGGGPGADSATESAECSPVGTDLAARAATKIDVELRDFSFAPASLQAKPGIVTFAARNTGSENHELAFLPGGGDVPLAKGKPDEGALEKAGAFELEAIGPAKSCDATYQMAAGTYTVFCIVTSADGKTHYDKGMRGRFVVA